MVNIFDDLRTAQEYLGHGLDYFNFLNEIDGIEHATTHEYNLKDPEDIAAAHDIQVIAMNTIRIALEHLEDAIFDLKVLDLMNTLSNPNVTITDEQKSLLKTIMEDDYDLFKPLGKNLDFCKGL